MIANPVLHKELMLRFRIRASNAPMAAVIGAIVLILVMFQLYGLKWLFDDRTHDLARSLWQTLTAIQYVFICLIAPSITANAITQEKEQQTWEMLVFTPLTAVEIVLGKLLARVIFVAALVVLFLPLSLICLGRAAFLNADSSAGIPLSQFFAAYALMAVSGVFFATVGLFASWVFKRTLYAIIASYTFVIGGLLLATTLITGALTALVSDNGLFEWCPLMWLNPGMLCSAVLSGGTSSSSPDEMTRLVFGLILYMLLTALILWRMIAGFRRVGAE